MTPDERIQELEATLRDIILGCNMMMQVPPVSQSFRDYILEVKRVASAPLEKTP